jgi:hypothetical protein
MLNYNDYKKRYGLKAYSLILKRVKKLKIKSKSKSSKVLYNKLMNCNKTLSDNSKNVHVNKFGFKVLLTNGKVGLATNPSEFLKGVNEAVERTLNKLT